MSNNIDRISQLIGKYIVGRISNDELHELMEWVDTTANNKDTFQRITNLRNLENELIRRRMVDHHRPLREMKQRISQSSKASSLSSSSYRFVKLAVAACAVIFVVAAIWLKMGTGLLFNGGQDVNSEETAGMGVISSIDDITHGETKAQLTLDDGTVIELGADMKKNEEKIHEASENQSILSELKQKKLSLSIPRGGEFKVTLEDGTEVWLNAESQLIYPEHFAEDERRVQIKGEAYFKVAKNVEKPFFVESAGQQIRVTGTEFNVNCYAEDQHVFTTLVSGSVALRPINGEGGEVILTPGHQAVFDKQQHKAQLRSVDTSVVTSWVKGSFVFEDQTLAQIMRDLSRWYNFQYQFMSPQAANTVFMGTVPRYGDFHDVLTILEKSGSLRFKLENNKLLIY